MRRRVFEILASPRLDGWGKQVKKAKVAKMSPQLTRLHARRRQSPAWELQAKWMAGVKTSASGHVPV